MAMIALGVLGALLTVGLYGLLRVSWPRLYYGPEDSFETYVSASFWSYFAFRTIPVAFVVGSLGAYGTRISSSSTWLLAVVFLFAYPSITSLLTVMGRRKNGRVTSRLDREWIFASSAIVAIGATVGVLIAPPLNSILPPGEALVEAIITALFVAVIAVLGRAMQLDKVQFDGIIDRTMKRLGPQLTEVESQCSSLRIPAEPFMAILVAENLQRPRWFRSFEAAASRVGSSKTLGPFQLPHNDDSTGANAETIDISTYLRHQPAIEVLVGRGAPRRSTAQREMFSAIYSLHNASSKFSKLCSRIAERFRPTHLQYFIQTGIPEAELHASALMISGQSATVWISPYLYTERGIIEVWPPGADLPLTWGVGEDDSQSFSTDASVFYSEWSITCTSPPSDDPAEASPKRANFYIQDFAMSEPRWS